MAFIYVNGRLIRFVHGGDENQTEVSSWFIRNLVCDLNFFARK